MRVRLFKRCAVEECTDEHSAHGFCGRHAAQWRRHGRITQVEKFFSAWDELMALAEIETDDCVIPSFASTRDGRPRHPTVHVPATQKVRTATAVIAEMRFGPRPGSNALHTCGSTGCVNYRHLRWGGRGQHLHGPAVRDDLGRFVAVA